MAGRGNRVRPFHKLVKSSKDELLGLRRDLRVILGPDGFMGESEVIGNSVEGGFAAVSIGPSPMAASRSTLSLCCAGFVFYCEATVAGSREGMGQRQRPHEHRRERVVALEALHRGLVPQDLRQAPGSLPRRA